MRHSVSVRALQNSTRAGFDLRRVLRWGVDFFYSQEKEGRRNEWALGRDTPPPFLQKLDLLHWPAWWTGAVAIAATTKIARNIPGTVDCCRIVNRNQRPITLRWYYFFIFRPSPWPANTSKNRVTYVTKTYVVDDYRSYPWRYRSEAVGL